MKIAFVTPAYYPANIGASLYCQTLAKGLTEKGHEVDVFVNAPKTYAKTETHEGISIKRFTSMQIGYYYISKGMLSSLIDGKFDIIHSHHYGYFPATAGLIAAKMKGIPHVFGPYYHPPVYGFKKSIAVSLYHATQGYPLLKYSNRVLPHTNIEKKMLEKIGCPREKMEILPNTVDTNRFVPGKKAGKLVLFVGNFIHEKGADVMFRIADKISKERSDIKFVFVGNLVENSFINEIRELEKRKNVKFVSNIPEKDLIALYQAASVLVLPSMYEAFSRVAAEAQSCGCPVVATNVGGLKEVVINKKTGFLVNYGDWGSFEEKIMSIADDKKAKMQKDCREHIVKNFDSAIINEKLIGIYEEVLREC